MPRPYLVLAISVVTAVAFGAACSTRRPALAAPPAVEAPSSADIRALIDRGCFRCLEQALAMAEKRGIPSLAFEASALLALRAAELGMPSDLWMSRARELAVDDPTWTLYVEIVASIPTDPLTGHRDDLLIENTRRGRARELLPAWRETLQSGQDSVVLRRYLDLALTCTTDAPGDRATHVSTLLSSSPEVPLLRFRAGICSSEFAPMLLALRTEDPDFVDADYALGRYAVQNSKAPDPDEALRRFRSAAAAFPSSTAIPTAIGNLYQEWEQWADALQAYESVLALLPSHPDAQLGRVISLSQLARHQEAIGAATTLIDGGRWFLGQAYYWRAWNQFNFGNNPAARADADRTRTLMVNAPVFVLSGMIEWRARHLEPAETELQEALTMDFGQCEAAFYLGGVRSERGRIPEAIAALNQARQCFNLSITVRRKAIDEIRAGAGTPQSQDREALRHERAIAALEKRLGEVERGIDRLQKVQSVK